MDLEMDGVYVANLFSRDMYEWDRIANHVDLVRGYILERYIIDTSPKNKLSEMRQYGGLSGAEYEVEAQRKFYERFLSRDDYNDFRQFLLAYELQKRHFARGGFGKMQEVRNMASRIQGVDSEFKPLRDAVHNQVSASLIPLLEKYRDANAGKKTAKMTDELISEIRALTLLDVNALDEDVAAIENKSLQQSLSDHLAKASVADGLETMAKLGEMMRLAREMVAAGLVNPADRRRAIDLNVIASSVMQSEGARLLEEPLTVGEAVAMMRALVDGAYGVGLLSARERRAAVTNLDRISSQPNIAREELEHRLALAERVVEWAQNSAVLAFSEVWSQWVHLMPEVVRLPDEYSARIAVVVVCRYTSKACRLCYRARCGAPRCSRIWVHWRRARSQSRLGGRPTTPESRKRKLFTRRTGCAGGDT